MQFTLQTESSQTAAPFCIGFAFRQGDIPAASAAVANQPNIQVSAVNRWPDGSLKFAVIAGQLALTAGQAKTVSFTSGSAAPAGKALTLTDLKTTGVTASIGCGSYGTASWATTDWDNAFVAWVSGPAMSSWIYRKPVGTDAHLVAWMEVRLFAGGAVEILPWVENGYIRVAGPTSKSATYTFTLGGTQRCSVAIDLPAHTRTPIISGSALSYWLGADPAITPKHDMAYLRATRLVPNYIASVAPTAARVTAQPTSYQPLQLGSYSAAMGMAGYQPAIGILPEWDVLYLTSTASAAYGGMVRNAYSAGRWGIHFRDENTNRPLRFSQYPHLSTAASTTNDKPPVATGTAAGVWDVPHHPSQGFMAYLATGRWFHMETVQFTATYNYLFQVDGGIYANRNYSDGIFRSDSGSSTTRGAGWAVRSLVQAVVATPDSDSVLRGEFIASLEANINFNHAKYVAQANNPFGWVKPYSDYTGVGDRIYFEATWMQDFYTAAFGYALAMSPPISGAARTKLSEFFAWKARSVVGRLGTAAASDWLYRDAATYTVAVAPSDSPDFDGGTGPWYADWGALYQATYATSPGARTEGDLRGAYFPEATSYWGNLQPAISYAVENQVPGAASAYLRMVSASNWGQIVNNFNATPVWGVAPASGL